MLIVSDFEHDGRNHKETYDDVRKFNFHQYHGNFRNQWILLGNQSTVNIFCNLDILKNPDHEAADERLFQHGEASY